VHATSQQLCICASKVQRVCLEKSAVSAEVRLQRQNIVTQSALQLRDASIGFAGSKSIKERKRKG
jgi:hypothetical protein